MKIEDICRKHGILNATYYNWKLKYSGLDASALKKSQRTWKCESPIKTLYAEARLENQAMKELFTKRVADSRQKRLRQSTGWGGIEHCQSFLLTSLDHSTFYLEKNSRRETDTAASQAINAVLKKSPHIGFWKCVARIRNKGLSYNYKCINRMGCMH